MSRTRHPGTPKCPNTRSPLDFFLLLLLYFLFLFLFILVIIIIITIMISSSSPESLEPVSHPPRVLRFSGKVAWRAGLKALLPSAATKEMPPGGPGEAT